MYSNPLGKNSLRVLISDNFIEHFGVMPDGTDQSAKIQSALDFYLANNVRSFGFEKSNKYSD